MAEMCWILAGFLSFLAALGQMDSLSAIFWACFASVLFLPFYVVLRLLEATLGWRS